MWLVTANDEMRDALAANPHRWSSSGARKPWWAVTAHPAWFNGFRERTMKSHSEAIAYGERSTTRICKCTGHETPFHRAPAAVDVRAWGFSRAARRVTNYRHLAADLL